MSPSSSMPAYVRGTSVPVSPSGTVDMNALIANTADRVTGQYYYTLKLAPGTTLLSQYNMFGAALNQNDPYPLSTLTSPNVLLSKVETNIPSAASAGLPIPYDIVIDSIGTFIHPQITKADLDTLTKYGYFEFAILGKVQWDGKFEEYPSGMGYTGFTSQSDESGWMIGTASPNDKKRFGRYGKYLAPQLQWSWLLYFPPTSGPGNPPAAASLLADSASPTPGVGAWIRPHMFGLIDRPVL